MRKLKFLILFVVLSFTFNVSALQRNSSDLKNRSVCSKFELAKANTDGSITKVECYSDYNSAKSKMNATDDNSLIILERSNNVTKVIDAKYALLYLDHGDVNVDIYNNSSFSSSLTYMNNSSNYGATDGALLEINYSNKAAKLRIAGVTGWIKNGNYYIIPVNWLKSYSYYKVTDNGIYHYYAKDIENTGYSQSNRLLDSKPSYLENANYKSFDGIYFYSDFISMIDDYRAGGHEKAVNKDNAYYNYHQYLPHRSKTNYDIDDFDSYIRNVLGFKGSLYGKFLTNNYSVMYGTSEYYLFAEKKYGANALSIFSLGRHESANGRSSIAYNKNNIFGHNAVDGAAYSSATGYLDVRSSIYTHGYGYVNYGYARVSDWRYNGSHFGNKNTGMNVQYASDVYWGEKAASYYYAFDKENGFMDRDYYQLIVSNSTNIYARTAPNTKASSPYAIKKTNVPFIVLEEVEGETVGGSNIWYKIQSDSNISDNGSLISSNSSTWPEYNWNGVVYVHSNYFTKINNAKKEDGTYNKPTDIVKDVNQETITTNANNTKYTPQVGILSSDKDFYYTSTLTNKKGTIKANSYVVILEKIVEGDNTNYLIITDYGTIQKAWISSENVKIVNKDLLAVSISEAKGTISILDKVGGTSVLSVYNGSFIPIVDKVIQSGKLYLKVQYKITDNISYGYVDSTISNITYTIDHINNKPVINAIDKNIIINEEFNPMDGVTGNDTEDGNITNKIQVVSNNVNISKLGTYEVKYSLTDSYGDTVTKVVKINVVNRTNSNALFMFNGLKQEDGNKFNFSGFIAVAGMDNKNVKQELIFVDEISKKEYIFPLTKWNDYPYEMTNVDDNKAYDYSGGWFNTTIDLTKEVLPNGNYNIYVHVINGAYEAKTLFTNIAYIEMTRRGKGNNREFIIDVDYSTLNSPLVFGIRDELISLDTPKSTDPMYNFFTSLSLNNNNLTIKGTSHSYGVSFGANDNIERKLIFENTTDFTRYEFDLGSITNGDYQVTLAVSDNLDKTRAWYNKTIDISTIPNGEYVVYIENTVNNISYYGEIIDASYTDFSKINSTNYIFRRNDDVRLRLELTVTK